MKVLNDIPKLAFNLKHASIYILKLLHDIIFGERGKSREVRRKLRSFAGFNFELDSVEGKYKIKEIKDKFTLPDLVTACHILDLDFRGDEDALVLRINNFLHLLQAPINTSEERESESLIKKLVALIMMKKKQKK